MTTEFYNTYFGFGGTIAEKTATLAHYEKHQLIQLSGKTIGKRINEHAKDNKSKPVGTIGGKQSKVADDTSFMSSIRSSVSRALMFLQSASDTSVNWDAKQLSELRQ